MGGNGLRKKEKKICFGTLETLWLIASLLYLKSSKNFFIQSVLLISLKKAFNHFFYDQFLLRKHKRYQKP